MKNLMLGISAIGLALVVASPAEAAKKSAKHKNSKQTPMPVDEPDERLDMTGWSGDYNLPK